MKNKILTFIIGFLVGAIIATTGFWIYSKILSNGSEQSKVMDINENGQMGGEQSENMGEPPEKPTDNNGEQPPTKPGESSNKTNN